MSLIKEHVTVDQMIAQLQNLSWQGKGSYHVITDDGLKGRYCTPHRPPEVDEDRRTVDLSAYGPDVV